MIITTPTDIAAIDQAISIEFKELTEIVKKLEFTPICEFELNESTNDICNADHTYPGIYLFEIGNTDKLIDIKIG